MMKPTHFYLLILLLLAACTFNSDEEYFENIEPLDTSKLSVELTDDNAGDTIKIFQATRFLYAISTNGGTIKSVAIKGAGVDMTTTSATGEFSVSSDENLTGTHILSIEFTASTGTGSVADVLGAEQVRGVRKWILVADLRRPSDFLVDTKIVDGRLRLSWPIYSKPNFLKYNVARETASGDYVGVDITDPKQNFWFDESFVGGPKAARYKVVVQSVLGSKIREQTFTHRYNVDFNFNKNDTTVTLNWKKNPFYGAFKEYVIKGFDSQSETITQIGDTARTYKLKKLYFGHSASLSFETNSLSDDVAYNDEKANFKLGDDLPVQGQIFYSKHLKSYVLQAKPYTMMFLNDEFEITSELTSGDFYDIGDLPYPGQFGYNMSIQIDLTNGVTKKPLMPDPLYYFKGLGNSLIAVRGSSRSFGLNHYVTYIQDPVSKKILYKKSESSKYFDQKVNPITPSDDGNYFLMTNEHAFYKIENDTSVLLGPFNPGLKFEGFRVDKSSELMFSGLNSVFIYDINNFQLLREIDLPETGCKLMSYDPQTKYSVWTKSTSSNTYSNTSYLINIETGNTKTIQTSPFVYLINGYLFLIPSGSYIKII